MIANRQRTDVPGPLSRRSWGGTRDKPKNVCVGGLGQNGVGHMLWGLWESINIFEDLVMIESKENVSLL